MRRIVMVACLTACSSSHPGVSIDAATDGSVALGTPITAPTETWTWVPFDDAQCANGTTTGIGVNLTTRSTRALIYLEGGGACWDALTCYSLMTAANFTTGYGASAFAADSTDSGTLAAPNGFFDRTAPGNPFKDYSFVYVPYCTGDVHAGANAMQYGAMTAQHVGFSNLTAYLKRLVPTFTSADRVVLAGSSAGGFGALYNWSQVQQYFGAIRVDMIDDSGTALPADILAMGTGSGYFATQRASWGLAATTPPGCTGCAQGLDALYAFDAAAFPTHRGALLSYVQDSVIPSYDGLTTMQFETGLTALTTNDFAHANMQYFLVAGAGHVLFFNPTLATNSTTLETWLGQMTTDDAGWANDSP